MKLLFLTTPEEDYLQDQLLLGIRRKLGTDCVDHPKKDVLYQSAKIDANNLYGRGFTIWKQLEDTDVDRTNVLERLEKGEFDVVVFSSIHRQREVFNTFESRGLFSMGDIKFVFIDGEDYVPYRSPPERLFYRGWLTLRKALARNLSPNKISDIGIPPYTKPIQPVFERALDYGHYYKRELDSEIYRHYRSERIHPISFGIPKSKIRDKKPRKTQRFPSQVQCEEAYKIPEIAENATREHLFSEEKDYYDDLASARFGITQMKGGWDCMRHYEIAANWTVPCFYELDQKPGLCAPHGLYDMQNCLIFTSASELAEKVEYVEKTGIYDSLQSNAVRWVQENTAERRAEELIAQIGG